jgi:hypothetical protein
MECEQMMMMMMMMSSAGSRTKGNYLLNINASRTIKP